MRIALSTSIITKQNKPSSIVLFVRITFEVLEGYFRQPPEDETLKTRRGSCARFGNFVSSNLPSQELTGHATKTRLVSGVLSSVGCRKYPSWTQEIPNLLHPHLCLSRLGWVLSGVYNYTCIVNFTSYYSFIIF